MAGMWGEGRDDLRSDKAIRVRPCTTETKKKKLCILVNGQVETTLVDQVRVQCSDAA